MDPVGRLVNLQLQIQEASISMKRMTEILDYEREQSIFEKIDTSDDPSKMLMKRENIDNSKLYQELESVEGDIELKNITFRYGNRKPVLKNISFRIPQGKKVAIVGASGSGKSTLTKLLLKYYEPEEGEILIDGIDIQEYQN